MTVFLVLGARAPAALEISRGLARSGHRVFAGDSMAYPVTRWSNCLSGYFRLPSPVSEPDAYVRRLTEIVATNSVDIVVPTCEEAFHLARWKHVLPKRCSAFVDDIAKLKQFHDKFTFMEAAEGCGIGIPRTMLLRSRRRLADSWERVMIDHDIVYKRVYSRFAEGTLVKPELRQIDKIYPTPSEPWIAQEYIAGEEICSYAVAVSGRVKAVSLYHPLHRAGRGAGICFRSTRSDQIEDFIRRFVRKHDFTGQIAFDFIVDPGRGAYVLECNPRATSGVHLLPPGTDWPSLFSDDESHAVRSEENTMSMVAAAMYSYGIWNAFPWHLRTWMRDFSAARDVILGTGDPLPVFGQFVATVETLARVRRWKLSPLAATTADIEWNGGPVSETCSA